MDKELKEYSYKVSQDLFGYFGYDDNWSDADIDVTVVLEKRTTLMDLHMQCEGTVLTPCDVTGEEFRLPVNGREELVIKFGDIPSEDDSSVRTAETIPSGLHIRQNNLPDTVQRRRRAVFRNTGRKRQRKRRRRRRQPGGRYRPALGETKGH